MQSMVAPHCFVCMDCRTPSEIARSNATRCACVVIMAAMKIPICLSFSRPVAMHSLQAVSARRSAAFKAGYSPVRSVRPSTAAVNALSEADLAIVAASRSHVNDRHIGHLVAKASLLRGVHGRIVKSITEIGLIGKPRQRRHQARKPRPGPVAVFSSCHVGAAGHV
jgi:hypothetical protein